MSEEKILNTEEVEQNSMEDAPSDETLDEQTDTESEISSGFSRRSSEAKWYVVHTYSGHENKVKVNIEKLVENRGMQDLILSVIVPTEDRVEYKDNQRKIKTRKMFPGYVIVKMVVTNESWYLVRNTQGGNRLCWSWIRTYSSYRRRSPQDGNRKDCYRHGYRGRRHSQGNQRPV